LLSLPIYPGLDTDAQDYVVENLVAAVSTTGLPVVELAGAES
jgi:dTDP-4-amino-4,6-dideoxygalactose transaminase